MIKFAGKFRSPGFTPKNDSSALDANQVYVRPTVAYPSRVTPGGSGTAKPSPKYTGTAMLGVGTMHKSNAVPIFSQEDAVSLRQMKH